MSRAEKTEVLVVGAGPVGMLTTLLLAESGVEVTIIDKECRTAAHSYACVLHPGTLQLLSRIGLAEEVCAVGRPVESVAFYEGDARRAELKLTKIPGDFPFALVLPQSTFEEILETRLHDRAGIRVRWNHRLMDLRREGESVTASIDKLTQTAKGYIVADWDWTVQKKIETTAAFVVGADGYDSAVRARAGIEYELLSAPEFFAVIEFETDVEPGHEVRITMDAATTSVLWPLPGDRCRWTFQLRNAVDDDQFPAKGRESVRILQHDADARLRQSVERLAKKRAPWFVGAIRDVSWSARIRFEHRLAKQFGKGRVWLAGDAAHQTGPIGAQSMNVGLLEAADLAGKIESVLHERSALRSLESYNEAHQAEWRQRFSPDGGLSARAFANSWIRDRRARVLSSIPASGDQLAQLVDTLGLASEPASAATAS